MKHTTSFFTRYLLAPALLGFALAGCGNKNDNTPAAGQLNVVHAASSVLTTVNVLLDGQERKNLFYGQASGYSELSAGAHTLQLQDASNAANKVSVPLTVDGRRYYSVYLYNSTPTQLSALSLTDDRAVPSPGTATLRFINLGYGAASVSLLRQDAAAKPIAVNVAATNNTGFLVVDPQAADAKPLTLEVRGTGGQNVLATQELKIVEGRGAERYGAHGHQRRFAQAECRGLITGLAK